MGVTCFCNFCLDSDSDFQVWTLQHIGFRVQHAKGHGRYLSQRLGTKDGDGPHALREAGERILGAKNAAKVAGKVRSIAPSNHPKWLEP